MRFSQLTHVPLVLAVLASSGALPASAGTTVADALKLVPIQRDVVYERPSDAEVANCKLAAEKHGNANGWIVRGPGGQLLRRFQDTNSDNKVDQWCYYHNGVEVYRDIDADFDEKADQYRWLGTAGMRWGLDQDEDGQIDEWKSISAEEATAELVAALRDSDSQRFGCLLLSDTELQSLGLSGEMRKNMVRSVQQAATKFREVAGRQRVVGASTKWVHFSGMRPGVVPAGTSGSTRDLLVYDNAVVMIETSGKPGQLEVGTLVRAGNCWRLIDLPAGIAEGQANAAAGGFFFASYNTSDPQGDIVEPEEAASEEVQKLVASLDKLEAEITAATGSGSATGLGALHDRRAAILQELAKQAKTAEEKSVWIRQLADTLSAAVQSGTYSRGAEKLDALFGALDSKSDLAGYVKFRQMSATYATTLQDADADFAKVQEQWLGQLEAYVTQYPSTPDAAEAMLQLAIAQEFAGNDDDARRWYKQIEATGSDSLLSKKAEGALRRLDSVGKSIPLRGRLTDGKAFDLNSNLGKVVLVHYWATWCEPCKQDLQILRELQTRYGKRGFSLVGVNLDTDTATLAAYLRQSRLAWPQMHEVGGLDGPLAVELGVLTLPTMVLIDEKGKVIHRNIHVSEVEGELRKRIR